MGKSFPADTELGITNYELRIIQRILTSHEMLLDMMLNRLQHKIKLLNYRNLDQIRDGGLKARVRYCGLAVGFIQSGTGFAL
ncbi:MAG TPA: hypothetical protein ENG83_13710 [Nitrospirae bacterium]|nr:hypothetical protein [Nitrospirota bacterium]HDZ01801.1 hypothetical protein [Nitrospirota bacterium]